MSWNSRAWTTIRREARENRMTKRVALRRGLRSARKRCVRCSVIASFVFRRSPMGLTVHRAPRGLRGVDGHKEYGRYHATLEGAWRGTTGSSRGQGPDGGGEGGREASETVGPGGPRKGCCHRTKGQHNQCSGETTRTLLLHEF